MTQRPHPAYGLTDNFRLNVLHTASMVGVYHAAEMHRVSRTSIYNWREWYGTAKKEGLVVFLRSREAAVAAE